MSQTIVPEDRYTELLEAGYAPADASQLARVRRFHGPSPTWTGARLASRRPEPEELEWSAPTDQERAESRRQQAEAAVRWAERWRTWPEHGDREAALQAALTAVNDDPNASRIELARVAANAARPQRREGNRRRRA